MSVSTGRAACPDMWTNGCSVICKEEMTRGQKQGGGLSHDRLRAA